MTSGRFILVLFVILAIGLGDYLSSERLATFAFYLAPIAYAAWREGAGASSVAVALAFLVWVVTNLGQMDAHPLISLWNGASRLLSFSIVAWTVGRMRGALDRERASARELRAAIEEIHLLRGLLPVCSTCRKIRDETQHWVPLETYLSTHTGTRFSHGYCPDCYRETLTESGLWDEEAERDLRTSSPRT